MVCTSSLNKAEKYILHLDKKYMKHKVKKMRRPVKNLCLILNPVLLPEQPPIPVSYVSFHGNLWICQCNLYATPILFYFTLPKDSTPYSLLWTLCFPLHNISWGSLTSVHWKASHFLKWLHSVPLFGCTIIYLPRLLTFGLFLVSSYLGREQKMLI